MASVSLSVGDTSVHDRTNEAGQFHFDGLPSGTFTLIADKDNPSSVQSSDVYSASIAEDATLDDITLKLKDGQSVHGRVIGINGAVVGAQVTLRPGNGFAQAPQSAVTTGADGVFDAPVAAGFARAQLIVAAPGYPLRVFDIAVDGHAVTLNMPEAGGTLDVTTPKDGNGIFFFQDDRYLTIMDLIQWLRAHGDPLPTAPNFHVSDLAPGRYRACTLPAGSTNVAEMSRCAEGFLAPYGELHLTIQ